VGLQISLASYSNFAYGFSLVLWHWFNTNGFHGAARNKENSSIS
jgi:hypothetical protein